MFHYNKIISISLSLFIAIINLSGCSSSPGQLNAAIYPSNYLNPNIRNQSSPVVISVFQLKSPNKFKQATFFALLNNPASVLADDLLDKSDIEVRPKKNEKIMMTLHPSTSYIGVMGAFRNAEKTAWRQLVAIKPGKNVNVQINVTTQGVEIITK